MMKTFASRIFTNGRIYTLAAEQPWVEAVAVAEGRIVATGTAAEVMALADEATDIVDLGGRMAMPGLIDVHNHILMAGQTKLFELAFPPTASVAEILTKIRAAVETTPEDRWIIGNQWGGGLIGELLTDQALAALDDASLGRPVLLRDETGHNRWVNSRALQLSNIAPDAPDPERGAFGRDPTSGRMTGVLIESAAGLAERIASQSLTKEMMRDAVRHAIGILNSYGITAFQEAASALHICETLAHLDRTEGLTAWVVASLPLVEPFIAMGPSGETLLAKRETFRTRRVMPNYTKLFLDGVPGAWTAAFHQAYLPDPAIPHGHRGEFLITMPELIRWIDRSESLGMGLKVHCAGDAAVTMMLDAIEAVRHFRGPTDIMHHVAHASYIQPSDILRFATLGAVADLCPIFWYPTTALDRHRQVMGQDRADRWWPICDLRDAGALLAGGTDWPVVPFPDVWTGIEGLVTRSNPSGAYPGEALWREQAIDLPSAIAVFTINAARAMGISVKTGSIENGKSADIIVLSQNIFDVEPERISATEVMQTYYEGDLVFER